MKVVVVTFSAPDGRFLVRADKNGNLADHGSVQDALGFYETIYSASYDLTDPTEVQVAEAAENFRTRFDPRVQETTVRDVEMLVVGTGPQPVDPADPSLLYGLRLLAGPGMEFHNRGWSVRNFPIDKLGLVH